MTKKSLCILGCDELGAYIHRFPHPQKRRRDFVKWISIVGSQVQELDPMRVYKSKRVCDFHFETQDKTSGHRLINSAVPTLYLQGVFKSAGYQVRVEHNYCVPRIYFPLSERCASKPRCSQGIIQKELTCQKKEKSKLKRQLLKIERSERTFKARLAEAETVLLRKPEQEPEIEPFDEDVKPDPLQLEVLACRSCLATDNKLYNIFVSQIAQLFSEMTGSELSPGDGLPQYICEVCKAYLAKFKSFRERCRRARAALLTACDGTAVSIVNTNYIRTMDRTEFAPPLTKTISEIIDIAPNTELNIAPNVFVNVPVPTIVQPLNISLLSVQTATQNLNPPLNMPHTLQSRPSTYSNSAQNNIVSGTRVTEKISNDNLYEEVEEFEIHFDADDNANGHDGSHENEQAMKANEASFQVYHHSKRAQKVVDDEEVLEVTSVGNVVDLTEDLDEEGTSSEAETTNTRLMDYDSDSDDLPDCLIGMNRDIYKKDTRRAFPEPKVKKDVPKRTAVYDGNKRGAKKKK